MKPVILLILLLLTPQESASEIKLEIGFVLSFEDMRERGFPMSEKDGKKEKKVGTIELIATHPSQLRPFIIRQIKDVRYLIAFDETMHEIRYIHTNDKNFKTSDGLKIGDCIDIPENKIVRYAGWEIHGEQTKDGWVPVLGHDLPSFEEKASASAQSEKRSCTVITGFSKGGN